MEETLTFIFEKQPWSMDPDYIICSWKSKVNGETGCIKVMKYVDSPAEVHHDDPAGITSNTQVVDEYDALMLIEIMSRP